jgi:hypothetical protein
MGRTLAAAGLLLLGAFQAPAADADAQLIMLEQRGCVWCARFNAEIAPGYANTEEGTRAPLRRVDIHAPIPDDLAHLVIERFTPTFILMHDNVEIDRIRGYPGDAFFWPMLAEMLAQLSDSADDD